MRAEGKSERVTAAVLFAVGAAALAASDAVIVYALDGAVHPVVVAFFAAFSMGPLADVGGRALFNETIALTTLVGAVLICVSASMAERSRGVTTSN